MTDNEIIKALECCNDVEWVCPQCKYIGRCKQLQRDALDLINRQKAEIERLEDVNIRLTKAEAIKEFTERLCEDRVSNDPVVIAVKVELETMVGDNNG